MRNLHARDPVSAIAQTGTRWYHSGMKWNFSVNRTSRKPTSLQSEVKLDERTLKLRAIERWENEGGKSLLKDKTIQMMNRNRSLAPRWVTE